MTEVELLFKKGAQSEWVKDSLICDVFTATEKDVGTSDTVVDFYDYLKMCSDSGAMGDVSVSANLVRQIDASEINKILDVIDRPIILNVHSGFEGSRGVLKNSELANGHFFYLDVFNLYPYESYRACTNRSLVCHEQLLSWWQVNACLSGSISALAALFSAKMLPATLNSCVYIFSKNEIEDATVFNDTNKSKDFLNNAIIKDGASMAIFLDIFRFYLHFYKIDIITVFKLSAEVENKIKFNATLLEENLQKYKKASAWHKDLALNAFSVNLGECMESLIVEGMELNR